MFFRKAREISALTRELCEKDDEIKRLERKDSESRATIEELKDTVFEIQTYYKTPDGCIPGPYCKGCDFKKEFEIMNYSNRYVGRGENAYRFPEPIKVRVCGKGNVCRSFMRGGKKDNSETNIIGYKLGNDIVESVSINTRPSDEEMEKIKSEIKSLDYEVFIKSYDNEQKFTVGWKFTVVDEEKNRPLQYGNFIKCDKTSLHKTINLIIAECKQAKHELKQ